jgi:S-adenosylmethionine decarboxylase
MTYQPGLHILAELSVPEAALLVQYEKTKECIEALINRHQLQSLGEVYHNFTPHGFTAVICLSESHISLHSWPEYNRIHLDVYLSNFLRNNDAITQSIYEALKNFYHAEELSVQTLKR